MATPGRVSLGSVGAWGYTGRYRQNPYAQFVRGTPAYTDGGPSSFWGEAPRAPSPGLDRHPASFSVGDTEVAGGVVTREPNGSIWYTAAANDTAAPNPAAPAAEDANKGKTLKPKEGPPMRGGVVSSRNRRFLGKQTAYMAAADLR